MSASPFLRRVALASTPLLAATGLVAVAAPAHAESTSMVISEAYGGGGNSGATWRNDYVELFNTSEQPVDLSGWTLEYWSASKAEGSAPSSTTGLDGTVQPGAHYLVQEAAGNNDSATPLPTPDATGTIPMSGTAARVAVVDAEGNTVDLLGWGDAAWSEGAPAPATSNTTSSTRTAVCFDTDNNAADFQTVAPTPENSSTTAIDCSTQTPPTPTTATIAQIQGAGHLSPLDGKAVEDVNGVVTAVGPQGFWMQSTRPDHDIATSEGIYVFTSSAPTVATRDAVTVKATVQEYRPGGSSGNDNLTTTELVGPTVDVTATNRRLPAPVRLGVDRTAPQQTIERGDPGSVEYAGVPFLPRRNAIDFYESLEGMRVAVPGAHAVGPTSSYGELPVVPNRRVRATRSVHGGVVYGGYDEPNAMRVTLSDVLLPSGALPEANVGDHFAGDVTGVLDYNFSNFMLDVTDLPRLVSGHLKREVTRRQSRDQLAVATFNVENLAPDNPQTKFDRLAGQVVHNLQSPDILAIEEIQDNTGATNDGTVDSTETTDKLIAAITAAGGPAYEARWINPEDGQDGGQPGGNIRSVFLFNPQRGVQFVDRPGGSATSSTEVTGHGRHVHVTESPGRIDPTSTAWEDSRKPLVGEFRFHGQTVFAIANHFASKGGDDPLFGRWQQPERFSETQRHLQAHEVRGFVDQVLHADRNANVVVLGDLNDFEFSDTANILVGSHRFGQLLDLPRTLPKSERYTYDYEGNSQVLDHIMLSPNLAGHGRGHGHARGQGSYAYDVVHTNSEFHDQDSDHDPQVVRLSLGGGRH